MADVSVSPVMFLNMTNGWSYLKTLVNTNQESIKVKTLEEGKSDFLQIVSNFKSEDDAIVFLNWIKNEALEKLLTNLHLAGIRNRPHGGARIAPDIHSGLKSKEKFNLLQYYCKIIAVILQYYCNIVALLLQYYCYICFSYLNCLPHLSHASLSVLLCS